MHSASMFVVHLKSCCFEKYLPMGGYPKAKATNNVGKLTLQNVKVLNINIIE